MARGLREAFGVTEFEDIRMIKGLAASMVYRIVVRGSPFLLKISMRTNEPARHYACMKVAAEAGVAPRVRYASPEDRISIEDFVNATPLPMKDALVRMPAVLRTLHALAPFPKVPDHLNNTCVFLMNKGVADGFLQQFRAADLLPKGESEKLFASYEQLDAAYPRHDADMVSSHNDLFKPENILFDGNRVWLVDWEASFRNDRYADLAVVANLVVTNDDEERIFLEQYFGQAPAAYQLARLFLMRQLAHMFYAAIYLMMGASGKPIDWNKPVPEFSDVQRRLWAGEIDLTDSHGKTVFGRAHWARFSENLRHSRYNEALGIVSGRKASA